MVISISWLLAATLLCFLTISISGTDKPFKEIQPNIHPKLRIWHFPREKSGASGQKKNCQKGLPPSLLIVNKHIPITSHGGSVGSNGGRKGKERKLLAGPASLAPVLALSLHCCLYFSQSRVLPPPLRLTKAGPAFGRQVSPRDPEPRVGVKTPGERASEVAGFLSLLEVHLSQQADPTSLLSPRSLSGKHRS